jgi:hypothetical protein
MFEDALHVLVPEIRTPLFRARDLLLKTAQTALLPRRVTSADI